MSEIKVTYNNLPEAVEKIMEELEQLKELIQFLSSQDKPSKTSTRIPVNIDRVCELTGKAKPTIYSWVAKRIIPSYKRGRTLYFFEDEIIEFIKKGTIKSSSQLECELNEDLLSIKPKKNKDNNIPIRNAKKIKF